MLLASFPVSYNLGEYLSFVTDYVAWRTRTKNGTVAPRGSWWQNVTHAVNLVALYALAPPVFLLKKHAVGDCVFTLTSEKIERKAKSGTIEIPWSNVVRVHRLSRAYLVEKKEGAMPLPYRCFTLESRAAFENFIEANNVPTAGDA